MLHRPGTNLTLSAPKPVSVAALIGGDRRILAARDRAVERRMAWVEKDVVQTRLTNPNTGRKVRSGGQRTVAATCARAQAGKREVCIREERPARSAEDDQSQHGRQRRFAAANVTHSVLRPAAKTTILPD